MPKITVTDITPNGVDAPIRRPVRKAEAATNASNLAKIPSNRQRSVMLTKNSKVVTNPLPIANATPKVSSRTTPADMLLKQFNGDLDAAIAALRAAQQQSSKAKAPTFNLQADAATVVDLQNIQKTYKLGAQKIEALKGASVQIKQGEFVALTGPSGSGKSTLLQLIGGLDKPSSGTVTIDGHDISKLSDRKLSVFRNKTIGFVFQFFYLQPFLKTGVNLEVPGMFARTPRGQRLERVAELAKAVGLEDRLKHLPKELSGGQMQRAAVARALLNKPKLLLADEPTGNLDQANGTAIIELFEQVRAMFGTTVIIVTHDPNIAARADREIKLKDGLIINGAVPNGVAV